MKIVPKVNFARVISKVSLTIQDGRGFDNISELTDYFDNDYNFQQSRDMDMLYSEALTSTRLDNTPFNTLQGFGFLKGQLYLKANKRIVNLEGISKSQIAGLFLEDQPDINNLKLADLVKTCPKTLTKLIYDDEFEGGLLSVFRLPVLKTFTWNLGPPRISAQYADASQIIGNHLQSEDRDLLLCKEELMNAGYKEYAKL